MRRLVYGMNLSVDGYVSAPGDDLGWSAPSPELFRWWLQREQAVSLLLYGRRLWEAMSSYWPTGDERPAATDDEIAFAQNWRGTPKVVFSSTLTSVAWNARLVAADALEEVARLKRGEGGLMRIGGAALGTAAVRAGLVDEFEVVTHPVLLGSGVPFHALLDAPVDLELVETETLPGGVVATRYAVRP